MPATTVSRGYPYPLDSDLIDVTLDIRRLAEAIDFDVGTALAPQALEIRPWTGGAQWGSLVHSSMFGFEYCLISTPGQPTAISSFTGQNVIIRKGAHDAGREFVVGDDFLFTGGHVKHMTPGSCFITPSQTSSALGDASLLAYFQPRDGLNNTHITNITANGRIYHESISHIFRGADSLHEALTVVPADDRVEIRNVLHFPLGDGGWYMTDPDYVRTWNNKALSFGGPSRLDANTGADQWTNQQFRVETPIGCAGIALVVHEGSWAATLRGNPGSTLAPCLDVMDAFTNGYIGVTASAYNTISSLQFKTDVQAVPDADLLTRADQVTGVSWLQTKPKGTDGVAMSSPYLNRRRIGVTAEALNTPFPEHVGLDDKGAPLTVDTGQIAATALATIGALSRKVNTLVTRIAALEAKVP